MQFFISSCDFHSFSPFKNLSPTNVDIRGAFKFYGILIFFSGMEADRNVKVVGGDVAVL